MSTKKAQVVVGTPPFITRYQDLELVAKLAGELCDAVDAAEEDIGGHRPIRTILGELGPAVDRVLK